jgi:MFS family permease
MGQWMDQIARSWLIYKLTGSEFQLGLIGAVRGLPLLVFGVLAGVVADRYGRKAQLIIAQVVNAILNVILATLVLTGHIQVWHIYVTGFLAGTVQAFQQPARQALINDLVGPRYLQNAIALNSAAFAASRSVGPALSGVFIGQFGVDVSYYAQAFLYAIATVWTWQIKIPETGMKSGLSVATHSQSMFDSAREGLAYILQNKLILALMVLGLAPMLLGMPYASLMPVFAIDVLHGDAHTQGLLLTMSGIGATIGALSVASFGRRQGNGKLLVGGAAGFGLSLVLFSRSPVLWMALSGTFLAGLTSTSYTSQDQTILQMITPSEVRGRVLGIYFLDRGLMPLGSLLAGTLAHLLGGPWAVTSMGAACFLVAVGVAILIPRLWRLKLSPSGETSQS